MITVDPHKSEQPRKMKPSALVWMLFLALAFGAGLATGYLSWGSQLAVQAQPPDAAGAAALPQATQAVQRIEVATGDDPSLGPADAPVTIIEFSDYECPYCRKWFTEAWPQIQKAYPNQVRLVYRDFPLSFHANSQGAALAASCAGEQGKFWPYHDLLFSGAALGSDTYASYASQLKLDMTQFQDCVASQKYLNNVMADLQYGSNLGITGTPTFFINGIPLVGAQPFSAFKAIIDRELASH
jgi:protein-disulfide isomerase